MAILKTDSTATILTFKITGTGPVVESYFSKIIGKISAFCDSAEILSQVISLQSTDCKATNNS